MSSQQNDRTGIKCTLKRYAITTSATPLVMPHSATAKPAAPILLELLLFWSAGVVVAATEKVAAGSFFLDISLVLAFSRGCAEVLWLGAGGGGRRGFLLLWLFVVVVIVAVRSRSLSKCRTAVWSIEGT